MTERAGWIGGTDEMLHTLGVLGADTDEEGRFLIYGKVVFGIGGDEAVVTGEAEYRVDGERKNLAAALRDTSYGVGVMVF
jgi:hypothetical protein